MLIMFIPTEEEHDLEEDESGTQQKGGMRASKMYRCWVGYLGFPPETAPFSDYRP